MPKPITMLDEMRLARSAARHLRTLIATQTLTVEDAARLLGRIDRHFDHIAGFAEPDGPARPEFTVIDGGRP